MSNLGGKLDANIQWDLSKLPMFEKNFYIVHFYFLFLKFVWLIYFKGTIFPDLKKQGLETHF